VLAIRPWLIEMIPATSRTGPTIANGIAMSRTSLTWSRSSGGCRDIQGGRFRSPAEEAAARRAKVSAKPRKLVTMASPNADANRPQPSMNRPPAWLVCVCAAASATTGNLLLRLAGEPEVSRVG
jgi:hypothetical protein